MNEFTAVAVRMQMMVVVDKICEGLTKPGYRKRNKTFKKSIFSTVRRFTESSTFTGCFILSLLNKFAINSVILLAIDATSQAMKNRCQFK